MISASVFVLAALASGIGSPAASGPARRDADRFRLMSGPFAAIAVNRVSCGFSNTGEICRDPAGSSTIGGGFWPRGTADQYIFASGPAVAAIIGPDGGPWAGDTTGGLFFSLNGLVRHGAGFTDIYNAAIPADSAGWPAAARVAPGALGDLFWSGLQGKAGASDGDVWWVAWEGDTTLMAGRPHPLGVALEIRVMAWDGAGGNEDILYALFTVYNISSLDPSDYAAYDPDRRALLLQIASEFHRQNDAYSGMTLPAGGYTLTRTAFGLSTDPDVANAGTNYSSVSIPFNMDLTWDSRLGVPPGWTLDPTISSPPFLPASGLVGTAFLPHGGIGVAAMLSAYSKAGEFPPPFNAGVLFRYFTNSLLAGDGSCDFLGPPLICYIRQQSPFDMRNGQSTLLGTLGPGASATVAMAYLFAAPVATGSAALCPACDIKPGSEVIYTALDNPAVVAGGVNPIDSIAGFTGAADLNGDGVLQAEEFTTVPRSLYGKAQVAQAFFDNGFLTPQAPAAPEFFLVAGSDEVTVLWRPSASEQTGDPYFTVAGSAQRLNQTGTLVPNPLYDPNFRQFDVEGYRIYRGRTDDPASLELLAQYDYGGTFISDYSGQINAGQFCAPEVGITSGCAITFDPIQPGVSRTAHVDIPLVGPIVQVRLGDRFDLGNGTALAVRADTLSAGYTNPRCLCDTGVPFVWVDNQVRNGFRYFYSVTAFDVNSWQSGPGSQESPRVLKAVTPTTTASNHDASVSAPVVTREGRGLILDPGSPEPTLEPSTGRFSGPFPPANQSGAGIADVVAPLLPDGPSGFTARLDSIRLGSPYASPPVPHQYWWTVRSGPDSAVFMIPIVQSVEVGTRFGTRVFPAVALDPGLAARYGGAGGYYLRGSVYMTLSGADYAGLYGRGCVNGRPGFYLAGYGNCAYNGSRWFDGPSPIANETKIHPNGGNTENFSGTPMTDYNNAGELTGVVTIHNTQAYQSVGGSEYRAVEGIKAGAHRAADFNVYWGAAGWIDSVIDLTHNVVVPFDSTLGGGWGILNATGAFPSGPGVSFDERPELTATDMGCVPPLRDYSTTISCGSLTNGATYYLTRAAVPGPVVFFSPSLSVARTAPAAANAGFILYLAGDWFTFELQGGQLPPAGRVWSLRQYVGAISGGNGAAGNYGPYTFSNFEGVRPLTAVGTEIRVSFEVTNRVLPPTDADLSRVHPVPDPYYLANQYETDPDQQVLQFVNLPQDAVIRIYSSSGVLVTLLEHHSAQGGGTEAWNVRNRSGRRVASGVYFYHIEAGNARRVGRMTIVNR
ncbi:MAG: hypothetical protein AB7I33_12170 [Gemmatimonadales bacterium]